MSEYVCRVSDSRLSRFEKISQDKAEKRSRDGQIFLYEDLVDNYLVLKEGSSKKDFTQALKSMKNKVFEGWRKPGFYIPKDFEWYKRYTANEN